MEHFETLVEEKTLEARPKRGPALEQKHRGQMPVTVVAILRSNGRAGRSEQIGILSKRIGSPLCKRIFLNHPCADGRVRDGVDQDEAARCSISRIWIKKERDVCLELYRSNFIHLQLNGRFVRQRVDVDAIVDLDRSDLCLTNGVFDKIGAP